jgi:hypothetical protein
MTTEPNARFGKCVDPRARLPIVAVTTEAIRTQRIDQNEEHVQIAAFLERENIVERSERTRVDDFLFAWHASRAQGEGRDQGEPIASSRPTKRSDDATQIPRSLAQDSRGKPGCRGAPLARRGNAAVAGYSKVSQRRQR